MLASTQAGTPHSVFHGGLHASSWGPAPPPSRSATTGAGVGQGGSHHPALGGPTKGGAGRPGAAPQAPRLSGAATVRTYLLVGDHRQRGLDRGRCCGDGDGALRPGRNQKGDQVKTIATRTGSSGPGRAGDRRESDSWGARSLGDSFGPTVHPMDWVTPGRHWA